MTPVCGARVNDLNNRSMKIPDISDYIKKDPSELTNSEILVGYQNYSKALEMYIEKMNSSNDIQNVSKVFAPDARVKITENTSGHEFDIDEIVTIVDFEPEHSQWRCMGKDGSMWYIGEHEGNVC
jgi:hypothetical protein